MGQRLSPSRFALARECLYTFRDDVRLPPDTTGPEAARGKDVHLAIEEYIRDGAMCESLPGHFVDWWESAGLDAGARAVLVELPIVYDFTAGTSLVVEKTADGRMPPTKATEQPCIPDVVIDRGDAIEIIDWKTGKPKDFVPQMSVYAAAVARLLGAHEVTARVVYVHADRTWSDMPMVFDALDIDSTEMALRDLPAAIPTAQPRPGRHCRDQWCRLRETCGAHREWRKGARIEGLRSLAVI